MRAYAGRIERGERAVMRCTCLAVARMRWSCESSVLTWLPLLVWSSRLALCAGVGQLATIGTQAIGRGHEPQHFATFRLHTVNASTGSVRLLTPYRPCMDGWAAQLIITTTGTR
eukprot:COSAG02_NODE_7442_length_3010_cov_99.283064_4_plen_114_part_00